MADPGGNWYFIGLFPFNHSLPSCGDDREIHQLIYGGYLFSRMRLAYVRVCDGGSLEWLRKIKYGYVSLNPLSKLKTKSCIVMASYVLNEVKYMHV